MTHISWLINLSDNDGTITRDEMLKIVTAIFSMVGKKEGMSDQDPKEKVEKIFSLMDKVKFDYWKYGSHKFVYRF